MGVGVVSPLLGRPCVDRRVDNGLRFAPQALSHIPDRGPSCRATTFEDLFLEVLKDTFDVEKRLVKALPKMAKAADDALQPGVYKNT